MVKCSVCSCEITDKPYNAPAYDTTLKGLCCRCAGNLNLFDNENYTEDTIEWTNELINSDIITEETQRIKNIEKIIKGNRG